MTTPSKTIAVVGLGYIGLPTASMFATHGHRVFGIDINPTVVDTLKSGRLHIEEPGLDTVVKAAFSSGRLTVDTKPVPADVFIIAVPTPYHHAAEGETHAADLSYVRAAIESILPHLAKGNLVILESTSPPGTTRDVLIPALEKKGFKVGADIGVAYCPERVIPGQAMKELIENDRVIGAVDDKWADETRKLYKSFVSGEIFLTTPTAAEMVKIAENTFRDINIAYANELAVICEKMGVDVWEVIRLANRHPRVNVHRPGPGVGGHCISVDPWFLVEMFPKEASLIKAARLINDAMPYFVTKRVGELVQGVSDPKILLLGLAYKANVDDVRESPSFVVYEALKKELPSATILASDPHVRSSSVPLVSLNDGFHGADLAILLTAHDEFKQLDPQTIGSLMRHRVVFDAHQVLRSEKWIPAGFTIHTLGRGGSKSEKVLPS